MTKSKCLNPKCDSPPKVRGLCQSCYSQAATLVRQKRTTWEKLIAAGKILRRHWQGNGKSTTSWLLEDEWPHKETHHEEKQT